MSKLNVCIFIKLKELYDKTAYQVMLVQIIHQVILLISKSLIDFKNKLFTYLFEINVPN